MLPWYPEQPGTLHPESLLWQGRKGKVSFLQHVLLSANLWDSYPDKNHSEATGSGRSTLHSACTCFLDSFLRQPSHLLPPLQPDHSYNITIGSSMCSQNHSPLGTVEARASVFSVAPASSQTRLGTGASQKITFRTCQLSRHRLT